MGLALILKSTPKEFSCPPVHPLSAMWAAVGYLAERLAMTRSDSHHAVEVRWHPIRPGAAALFPSLSAGIRAELRARIASILFHG